MAKRAGARITELDGSHVIMVSQPRAVTDVILDALGQSSDSEGTSWASALVDAYLDERAGAAATCWLRIDAGA
jgi:hypothetical protein